MKKAMFKEILFGFKQKLKRIKCEDKYSKLFVKEMNKKAYGLGMTATRFAHPDGSGTNNKSTAHDLLFSVVAAYRNEVISSVWTYKNKEIICTNTQQRNITLHSTLHIDGLLEKYKILGGKTGSWLVPTKLVKETYNLAVVAEIDGRIVAAVIANANSEPDRFASMEELLNIARCRLQGEPCNNKKLSLAMCGAVCEILPDGYTMLFAQNAELHIVPASLAKLTALLVACDYITDLDEHLTFSSLDMVGGSGNYFLPGDSITFESAFYAMLLPSSNSTAVALSKAVGKKIANKNFS